MHNKMEQFKDMDAQLIDEVGKGNQAAFDILFSKYNNKLYASLLAFTKSQDLAEDLTQKTFIRVWKKIETFRGDSSLFTWIYRIAINLAKNEFSSKQAKNQGITDNIDDTYDLESSVSSPESHAIEAESMQAVMDFIASLPTDLREAISLREFDGKSYEEIAQITGSPIGTVRSRIFRAREEILNFMKEEEIYG
ncbi:MAG: sigma-70 family RNA polymerase sigma factor [Gammaproteobacteria bacterium]|jgi:RNA polymerase sigma-70 factor (ECF subfamily)